MFLGIEIGGTKLQLGVGPGDGTLAALWRGAVDPAAGGEGIRRQIVAAVPELLAKAGLDHTQLRGVGIGFGGPVDDDLRVVIRSHQIREWENFPLADWMAGLINLPVVVGNDADVAGLAEALFGAGKGTSPIFYITVGSGIGGGLVIDGDIYRGSGRGAAEIGHLRVWSINFAGDWVRCALEEVASGWAIQKEARTLLALGHGSASVLPGMVGGDYLRLTTEHLAQAAERGDEFARGLLKRAWHALAEAIAQMITLLCPRLIIIGGGVAQMGEKLFFEPVRYWIAEQAFPPFSLCYDIVPAALGEEVVVHGALALARKRLNG